ncbi:MAG: leucine-rich repeat protein [Anaerovoracaceae bacterium]
MKKRVIISVLVASIMVITTTAMAFGCPPPSHFKCRAYKVNGSTIYISPKDSGTIEGASKNVKAIPAKVNGVKIKKLGNPAFTGTTGTKSLTLPKSVVSITGGCFVGGNLETIKVAPGNKSFKSVAGILYTKNMKTIIAYPSKKKSTSYVMPSSVQSAGMPTVLGGKYLKSVTISQNCKSISQNTFINANNLEVIKVAKGNKKYKAQNGLLMSGNKLIAIPNKLSQGAVIPNGVESSYLEPSSSGVVYGIPKSLKAWTFVSSQQGRNFYLFDGEKSFANHAMAFVMPDSLWATITGGYIKSSNANSDGTISLEMKSTYYDKSAGEYNGFWIRKSNKDPWFMDKQFDVYRNGKKISTVDYRYNEDIVKFRDKTPVSGKNTYHIVPKFKMKDGNGKTVPVTWYKSSPVSVTKIS